MIKMAKRFVCGACGGKHSKFSDRPKKHFGMLVCFDCGELMVVKCFKWVKTCGQYRPKYLDKKKIRVF